MMPYYTWKMIGLGGSKWENHLYPGFRSPDPFIAVCGRRSGALNGESANVAYCEECKRLQPEAETAMQAIEATARQEIVTEEKPRRAALVKRLTGQIRKLSCERLNELEEWLKETPDE